MDAQFSFLDALLPRVEAAPRPLTTAWEKLAFLAAKTKEQEWTPPTREELRRTINKERMECGTN